MPLSKPVKSMAFGSSSDGKPETFANNTLLFEIDTGNTYKFVNNSWTLFSGPLKQEILFNKTIDFSIASGNVITNLPNSALIQITDKTKLPTDIAYIADTQTLTNKTIDITSGSNTITGLTNSSIASGAAIAYSKLALSNSVVNADVNSAAAIAYSKLNLGGSIVNADISTSAAISKSKLGALAIVDADVSAHTSTKITISNKAQLPNDSVYLNDTQTITNKTADAKSNTFTNLVKGMDIEKYGAYTCNANEVDAYGLLHGMIGYGSLTLNEDNNGSAHLWATGTAAESFAGVVAHKISSQGITRRTFAPRLVIRNYQYPKSTTDSRFYCGLPGYPTVIPNSDTPLSTTQFGFLLGWRSTDSNYQIFTNDGAGGAMRVVDTGVAIPAALNIYTYEFILSASNIIWKIYNISGTQLATGTETVQIPTTTQNLWVQNITQNTTTTSKNLGILAMAIWSPK